MRRGLIDLQLDISGQESLFQHQKQEEYRTKYGQSVIQQSGYCDGMWVNLKLELISMKSVL